MSISTKDIPHNDFRVVFFKNRIGWLSSSLSDCLNSHRTDKAQDIACRLKSENLDQALAISDQLPNKPRFSKEKPQFDTDLHDDLVKYITDQQAILNDLDTDAFIAENHRINSLFYDLVILFSAKVKNSRRLKNEITIYILTKVNIGQLLEFGIDIVQALLMVIEPLICP